MDDRQFLLEAADSLEALPLQLITLRKRYRITQSELAKELGVAIQQVSRDETEIYSGATRIKLRRVLDALLKLIEQKTQE